jgi:hypothetical protein
MINLKKIIFDKSIEENSIKEVKKDLVKFDLTANDLSENIEMQIVRPYDHDLFVLSCGYLLFFKFPKGSTNQEFESRGIDGMDRGIKFTFNYNNKQYEIHGHV